MKHPGGALAVLLALAGFPLAAVAVEGVFSAGGGSSSGSGYTLNGTIGQPVAGTAADGRYVLRSGIWHIVMELRLNVPGSGFDNWINGLAPADQPPEGLRGPLDEPAGDGVPNIFKYAMGLLPMTPARDGYPRFAPVADPENPGHVLLAIEFIRSTTADVILSMEGSPDMAGEPWPEVPFTLDVIESLPDDRERVRLQTSVSLLPDESYFLRLSVDLP